MLGEICKDDLDQRLISGGRHEKENRGEPNPGGLQSSTPSTEQTRTP